MDPVSITTSVTALLGATAIVIQYLVDLKEGGKERHKLEQEVTSLLIFLQNLRSRVADSDLDEQWYKSYHQLLVPGGALDQMSREIQELTSLIKPADGKLKRIGSKFSWNFEKEGVYKRIERINRLKDDVNLALGQDQFSLSLQIKAETTATNRNVQSLQNAEADREAQEVKSWLSSLDFLAHHAEISAERSEGTGSWFLQSDHCTIWKTATSGSMVLFSIGGPGVGKTMLASTVIDDLRSTSQDQHVPILFVYFDYKAFATQTSANITSSLLRQLCDSVPGIPTPILQCFQEHRQRGTRPSLSTLNDLLIRSLREVPRSFIVIDALDEASEDTRVAVLELAQQLQWQERTRFMITSRPIDGVDQFFETQLILCDGCDARIWGTYSHCSLCNNGDHDLCLSCQAAGIRCSKGEHELETRATIVEVPMEAQTEDLEIFVAWTIQRDARLRRCVLKQPKLQSQIVDTILQNSQGMFLIAKLLLENLKGKPSPASVTKALATVPTGSLNNIITQLYETALDRIRQQGQDSWNLAIKFISLIVLAYRPLSTTELQQALAVQPDSHILDEDEIIDTDLLINICAGLVDTVDDCFHLVHKTAQEYFDAAAHSLFPQAQEEISRTCLTYLMLDDFKNGPSKGFGEDEAFLNRLEQYPFYNYAAQCWGAHLTTISPLPPDLRKLAVDFLEDEPKRSAAVQAMWYLNSSWDIRGNVSGLHLASFFGLAEVIQTLVEHGSEVNGKDSMGTTPITYAAKSGSPLTVTKLLEAGADINTCDSSGGTPLLHAVNQSHEGVVAAMLQRSDLDVNYNNSSWHASNALMIASTKDCLEIVKILLGHPGTQVNCCNDLGRSALWLAAYNGHVSIASELLAQPGIRVDSPEENSSQSPLRIAAFKGHLFTVMALLDAGADINCKDKYGGTPLLRACDAGHTAVVELLLRRGADTNIRDVHQRTVLHGAAVNGHPRVVKVLLEAGMDPNVKGVNDETPLRDCTMRHSPAHTAAAELLIAAGADTSHEFKTAKRAPLSTDEAFELREYQRIEEHEAEIEEQRDKEWRMDAERVHESRRETPPPPYAISSEPLTQ